MYVKAHQPNTRLHRYADAAAAQARTAIEELGKAEAAGVRPRGVLVDDVAVVLLIFVVTTCWA